MTITHVLLLIGAVTAVVVIALIVINYLEKRDEQDNLSEGYVLCFNSKTKTFEQWPSLYFHKFVNLNEEWTIIGRSFNSEIEEFELFLQRGKYHPSTGKQAINAFDEYLESKLYD